MDKHHNISISNSTALGRFASRVPLFIVALLLFVTTTAKANPVDMRLAREVGAKFVNGSTQMRTTSNDLRHVVTYSTATGEAAFHVFNTSNGFVIVAADDCATPILGYSDEGCFDVDNIPVQLTEWLQGYVEEIQYGIEHQLPAGEYIANQWECVRTNGTLFADGNRGAVAPLINAMWGQGCYYNSLCPEDSLGPCGRVYTGCVATAMSLIMHYWSYPTSGTGSYSYTPDGYPTQTVNFGATTYDWANMPNQLTSSSSTDEINAVATLMWHCGVAVNMMYGNDGSGAYSSDVPNALTTYFNYSTDLFSLYRSTVSDNEWLSMLKASLNLGYPLYYSGDDGESGHAFVCDGYNNSNQLHFNWGWSGYANGYYTLGALNPDGYYPNKNNFAIFRIHPEGTAINYSIEASPYPTAGGTVTGTGIYGSGATCTLTAIPDEGYTFMYWTEYDEIVSNNPSYSFIVNADRSLVANFAPPTCAIDVTPSPTESGTITFTQEKTYGFDDGTLEGWTLIDADGDGYTWVSSTSPNYYFVLPTNLYYYGHNYSRAYVCSGSYTNVANIALTPDNYLVSPRLTLGGSISLYVQAQDANYAADHFGVAVSTTSNTNPNDFTLIAEWTLAAKGTVETILPTRSGNREKGNWYKVTADLSAYAGQTGYVAIRHFDCTDQFVINLDDITIQSYTGNQIMQGANCILTAVPNSDYTFESWTEDGVVVSTSNPCSITVSSNRNITANFCALGEIPTGALNGLFSISEDAQVRFSQGNLQYQASTNTWRFAENQWDFVGTTNTGYSTYPFGTVSGSDNANISQNYSGWIDLFGWGTSGWNNGNIYYHPYNCEYNVDLQGNGYGPTNGITNNFDLTGPYANADWGVYNAISNGGNQAGMWRTLTREEWYYLLFTRGTLSGTRYAMATVNGVRGLIVVPDDWPEELAFNNPNGGNFNSNTITAANWTNILEANGAVFLPAGGYRNYNYVDYVGRFGRYWSSTNYYSYSAGFLSFYYYTNDYNTYQGLTVTSTDSRDDGMSVRLVHPLVSVTHFSINATSLPVAGGSINGTGDYLAGATCTLTATAKPNYTFMYWSENGTAVSFEESYSFTVTVNRNLVANFEYQGEVLQGSINNRFSVSANTEVYFSQGNLQYKASTNTWRFATNQWDFVGTQNTNNSTYSGGTVSGSDNENISQNYGGWIDLFGWGTSGWNNGNLYYFPYSYGYDSNIQGCGYGPTNGISYTFGLTGTYANADWGVYNAISNGGNQAGLWRTLTGDEWEYLLNTRYTTSGIRYVFATVNGIYGLILLPDNWPAEYAFNEPNGGNFYSNIITYSNWYNVLEPNGAIFLPAAGRRTSNHVYDIFQFGNYWASSCYPNSYSAHYFNFYYYINSSTTYTGTYVNSTNSRYQGMSVRLVHEAEVISYYSINATPNPAIGGTVTGEGTYVSGTTCTLTATANDNYTFVNWTKNGILVSTEPTYSFVVTEDADYIANFRPTSCTINASATNGIVIGTGTYNYGETCTLQAIPNTGYQFIKWTENGIEVSTDAVYTFVVTSSRNLVANFNVMTHHWEPENSGSYMLVMGLNGVIQIDGVEQYSSQLEVGAFCGTECRGSQMATEFFLTNRFLVQISIYGEIGDEITFRLYDHSIGEELNLTPPPAVIFTNDGYGTPIEPHILNFISAVSINATTFPENAGNITGTGDYAIDATCTLIATANDGFIFSNWTENGEIVSTEAVYTFSVTGARDLVANFLGVHTQPLASGWNWWSTYIEQNGINGLSMLENSLGTAGLRIQSRNNGYVDQFEYSGNYIWYGTLNSITNEQSYMIRTNEACNAVMTGEIAPMTNHPITIGSGWSWIGFPCTQSIGVTEALSGFSPEANDVIKSRNNGYSTYIVYGNNALWYGTLNTLQPGQGYMFLSNSNEMKTLVFQTGRGDEQAANITTEGNTFQPEDSHFAYNMTVTAVIELDGSELRSDDYELAAFVGDECRGSIKLMYVEPLNRYEAFLTVFGEAEEHLDFVLTDGTDASWSSDHLTYEVNGTMGTPTEPAVLHFAPLGLDESWGNVQVFPNPSEGIFNVTGKGIQKVEVVNAYGQVIYSLETQGETLRIDLSNMAAGTYLLRVMTNQGITTKKLVTMN